VCENHYAEAWRARVTDKIVSIDQFKVLKKQADDDDDRAWKDKVLATIDLIKERVESGETSALMMVELHDEIGEWRTHILGFASFDHLTAAGILEMTKLQVLDSVYDE
jgi:hypothetical protein